MGYAAPEYAALSIDTLFMLEHMRIFGEPAHPNGVRGIILDVNKFLALPIEDREAILAHSKHGMNCLLALRARQWHVVFSTYYAWCAKALCVMNGSEIVHVQEYVSSDERYDWKCKFNDMLFHGEKWGITEEDLAKCRELILKFKFDFTGDGKYIRT
ncbi:MAG: hypothetical protein A2542_02795 [Parcubacteria group bacterium RIFOXYD2_FULL_52_8]|nr:MAG: hypothetical protein A2542_02795 [Parcubacteria group bacterium RIFOXYD2_FULL_52_8]